MCLYTLKFERGSRITDIDVRGIEVFAIASEDGTVSVRQMVVKDKFNKSFVYDDVSNPVFTSDTLLF